jgi:hypothetical protein
MRNVQTALFPKPSRADRATRLPDNWQPDIDDIGFATMCGFSQAEAETVAAQFRDYWLAASGARARKCNWAACWRCWCRNEVQFRSRHRGVQNGLRDGMRSALNYARQP